MKEFQKNNGRFFSLTVLRERRAQLKRKSQRQSKILKWWTQVAREPERETKRERHKQTEDRK